ncbi:putative leucine-rich repeat-containing protein DDB_G0290503 [Palaemon carinicauda]|uniref:putative leucine-rich repeat-containing protein DDB_G0290503 n=1 Tax=Palaemon carinicauda TaxID=392227 RepID=UPI0035B5CF30
MLNIVSCGILFMLAAFHVAKWAHVSTGIKEQQLACEYNVIELEGQIKNIQDSIVFRMVSWLLPERTQNSEGGIMDVPSYPVIGGFWNSRKNLDRCELDVRNLEEKLEMLKMDLKSIPLIGPFVFNAITGMEDTPHLPKTIMIGACVGLPLLLGAGFVIRKLFSEPRRVEAPTGRVSGEMETSGKDKRTENKGLAGKLNLKGRLGKVVSILKNFIVKSKANLKNIIVKSKANEKAQVEFENVLKVRDEMEAKMEITRNLMAHVEKLEEQFLRLKKQHHEDQLVIEYFEKEVERRVGCEKILQVNLHCLRAHAEMQEKELEDLKKMDSGLRQALCEKDNVIDALKKEKDMTEEKLDLTEAENIVLRANAEMMKKELEDLKKKDSGLRQALCEKDNVIDALKKQKDLSEEKLAITKADIIALRANAEVMKKALEELEMRYLDDQNNKQELLEMLHEGVEEIDNLKLEKVSKVTELEGQIFGLEEKVLNLEEELKKKDSGLRQALCEKDNVIDALKKQKEMSEEKSAINEAYIIALRANAEEMKKALEELEMRYLDDQNNKQELLEMLHKGVEEIDNLKLEKVTKVTELEGQIFGLEEKVLNLEEELKKKDSGLRQALCEKDNVIDALKKQKEMSEEKSAINEAYIIALRANAEEMKKALEELEMRYLDDQNNKQELLEMLHEGVEEIDNLKLEKLTKVTELEGQIFGLEEKVLNLEEELKKKDSGLRQALCEKDNVIDALKKQKDMSEEKLAITEADIIALRAKAEMMKKALEELEIRYLEDQYKNQALLEMLQKGEEEIDNLKLEKVTKVTELEGQIFGLEEKVLNLEEELKKKDSRLRQVLCEKDNVIDALKKQKDMSEEKSAINEAYIIALRANAEEMKKALEELEMRYLDDQNNKQELLEMLHKGVEEIDNLKLEKVTKVTELEGQIDTLEKQVQLVVEEKKILKEEIHRQKDEIELLLEAVEDFEKRESLCDIKMQELGTKLEELTKYVGLLEVENGAKKAELKKVEELEGELSALHEQVLYLQEQLEQKDSEAIHYQEAEAAMNMQIADLQLEIFGLHQTLNLKNTMIQELENKYSSLPKEQLEQKDSEAIHYQEAEAAMNMQIADLQLEIFGLHQTLNLKNTMIQELENKYSSLPKEQLEQKDSEAIHYQEAEAAMNLQISDLQNEIFGLHQALNLKHTMIQELENTYSSLPKELAIEKNENVRLTKLVSDYTTKLGTFKNEIGRLQVNNNKLATGLKGEYYTRKGLETRIKHLKEEISLLQKSLSNGENGLKSTFTALAAEKWKNEQLLVQAMKFKDRAVALEKQIETAKQKWFAKEKEAMENFGKLRGEKKLNEVLQEEVQGLKAWIVELTAQHERCRNDLAEIKRVQGCASSEGNDEEWKRQMDQEEETDENSVENGSKNSVYDVLRDEETDDIDEYLDELKRQAAKKWDKQESGGDEERESESSFCQEEYLESLMEMLHEKIEEIAECKKMLHRGDRVDSLFLQTGKMEVLERIDKQFRIIEEEEEKGIGLQISEDGPEILGKDSKKFNPTLAKKIIFLDKENDRLLKIIHDLLMELEKNEDLRSDLSDREDESLYLDSEGDSPC